MGVIFLRTNRVSKKITLQMKVSIIKCYTKILTIKENNKHPIMEFMISKNQSDPNLNKALFIALLVTFIHPKFCRYCILYLGTVLVKKIVVFIFLLFIFLLITPDDSHVLTTEE